MRARWLKPEFFRDKKIADMGPVAALVYQALWCLADDSGVAPCEPERIKGEMFVWWSAVGVPEISGALRHLSGKKILTIFRAGDDVFCRLSNFKKHQPIHKPSKFRYPSTGEALTWDGAALVPEQSGISPEPVVNSTPIHPSSTAARELFLSRIQNDTQRTGWVAMLNGWAEGMGAPGGKAFTVEQIDAGLAEYLANEAEPTFTARHVVRYVEQVAGRKEVESIPRPRLARGETGFLASVIAEEAAKRQAEEVARGVA